MIIFYKFTENRHVRLGAHDLTKDNESQQDIPIASSLTHPDYNWQEKTNDIAILTLEHEVEFTGKLNFDIY